MLTLVIWFVALVTVVGSSNTVESSPAQTIDLNKVLRLFVKQQRLYNPSKQRILRLRADSSDSDYTSDSTLDSYSDYSDDSDDSDDSKHIATEKRKNPLLNLILNASKRKAKMNFDGKLVRSGDVENARLAKERIIDLIETVSANEKEKNNRITNRKGKPNQGQSSYLFRNDNYDSINNNLQKQILEQLLSQTSNVEERQLKPKKKRLIPNRLTPTVTMDDVKKYYENKNNEVTGLEDYSKVYIVLNPQAAKNSKNKNALNDLISKVLSLSSQTPKRESQQVEPFRYKGFVVKGRPFKEINENIARMGDDEKLAPPAAADRLDRITAMPIQYE